MPNLDRFLFFAVVCIALSSCASRGGEALPVPPGENVAPGVWVLTERDPAVALSRTTVFVQLHDVDLRAVKGGGELFALETVPSMAARHPEATVAINADFFEPDASPTGMFVNEQGIWRGPWIATDGTHPRGAIAWTANEDVFIGVPRVELFLEGDPGEVLPLQAVNVVQPRELPPEGAPHTVVYNRLYGEKSPGLGDHAAVIQLKTGPRHPNRPANGTVVNMSPESTVALDEFTAVIDSRVPLPGWIGIGEGVALRADFQPLAAPVEAVLGGLPLLVEDGQNVALAASEREAFPLSVATSKQPRSAVGVRHDGRELVLVAWDGRRPERAGATLPELADYFISLGCSEALNFDGGGSTVLVVNGDIANQPSDIREDGGTRPVGNALLVVPR